MFSHFHLTYNYFPIFLKYPLHFSSLIFSSRLHTHSYSIIYCIQILFFPFVSEYFNNACISTLFFCTIKIIINSPYELGHNMVLINRSSRSLCYNPSKSQSLPEKLYSMHIDQTRDFKFPPKNYMYNVKAD